MVITIPPLNKITPEKIFIINVLIIYGGNYLYNLILGRVLGPDKYTDAALSIFLRCYFFPNLIINILFGNRYLQITPL